MKLSDLKDLVMMAGVGYAIYWIINNKDKFDPSSDKNIAYQTASAWVKEVSGGKYLTVGDWLYGMFGSNELSPIVYSPFTKADGTRSMRVTRVARIRDGKEFTIDYSGSTPRLIAV